MVRFALAALLALRPVVQAAELAPVDILLTHVIPEDEAALATAGPEKGARLAKLQSDLALVVEGLEGFASEKDASPSLKRLRESVDAQEQLKDRASALDAAPAPRARSYSSPSSSYGSNANAKLGEALGELAFIGAEALIFKGIPALFRGIGSLFSKKKKTSSLPSRQAAIQAPIKAPEKLKEPPTLTALTLEVTPKSAAPGESVTLTAKATLSDPEASKVNIAVTFKGSPGTLVRFNGTPQAKTNASGVATISATVRRDHGVRAVKFGDSKAVKGKSDSAQNALDDEVRAMSSESAGSSESSGASERDEKIEFGASATVVKSLSASASLVLSDKTKPECKFEPVDIPETVGAEPFAVKMRFSCTQVEGLPDVPVGGHEIVLTIGADGEPQQSVSLHTDSDGYAFAVFQASGTVNPLDQAVGRADDGRLVSAANPNAVLESIEKAATDPAIRQIVVTSGKTIIVRATLLLSLEAAGAVVVVGGVVVTATIYWKMRKDDEQYSKGTADARIAQRDFKEEPKLGVSLNPPGDCTKELHRRLQDEVDRLCGKSRACTGLIHDCAVIRENIGSFAACIASRSRINKQCFRGGNIAHKQALQDNVKGLIECQNAAKKEGCL